MASCADILGEIQGLDNDALRNWLWERCDSSKGCTQEYMGRVVAVLRNSDQLVGKETADQEVKRIAEMMPYFPTEEEQRAAKARGEAKLAAQRAPTPPYDNGDDQLTGSRLSRTQSRIFSALDAS